MKQFKALLIKEWHTHKFTFLIPSFVLGAFLFLAALVSIFARIRYGSPTINLGVEGSFDTVIVMRSLHSIMAVVLGWFAILTSMTLTDHLLNHDYLKKCEIMHHSQPVSLVKMLAAKFVFSVPMMLVQYLILTVISSLILSAVSAFLGFNSWGLGLTAALSQFLLVFVAMMSFSSLLFLFAAAFRKQVALKLIMTLLVIDLLGMVLTRLWGVADIFSPLRYYLDVFYLPFRAISIQGGQISMLMPGVLSQAYLVRLGVSVLMYIAGYFIYKQRELS